jgi:hypothetical protein
MTVRITRPLIGTAIGAGLLGASLALGVTMASASTTHSAMKTSTSSGAATPAATPKPAQVSGHKCPHMSGSGTKHSMQQG